MGSVPTNIKNIQATVNDPYICKVCGSSFQYQVSAGQYNITDYGVRQISSTPQFLYICLCGEPIIPKNIQTMARKGGEREGFIESVTVARKHRNKNSLADASKSFVSIEEFEELRSELEALRAALAERNDSAE
jgi:hypothetical protein